MNNNLSKVIKEYINEDYSVDNINRGYVHRKWLITSKSKNKVFIKEFLDISPTRIEFINYIQSMLRDFCPQIIKNRNRKTYTVAYNIKYVAYEFVEGENLKKVI